jgi:hypothetical protein
MDVISESSTGDSVTDSSDDSDTDDSSDSSEFDSEEEVEDRMAKTHQMIEDMYANRINPDKLTLAGPPKPKTNFTYQLKIFIGFLQVVTQIGLGMEILWPNSFKSFLAFFQFFNFDRVLAYVFSSDCVSTSKYYRMYIITVATPIVMLACIVVFFLVPAYFNVACFRKMNVAQKTKIKMRFWLLFLYSLFLVYPAVSSKVLRLYICKNFDGVDRLLADVRVECYTSQWYQYAIPSSCLILVYPLGIPLLIWSLLRTNRKHLDDPRVQLQLGFLYAGYKEKVWYWDVVDSLHKLVLTSFLSFLPVDYQLPFGMCVSFGYLQALLHLNPYVVQADDIFHQVAQVEIFLLIAAGHVFTNMSALEFDAQDDVVTSLALIAITLVVVLLFIGSGAHFVHSIVKRRKQKVAEVVDKAAAAEAEKARENNLDGPGLAKRLGLDPEVVQARPLDAETGQKKSQDDESADDESGDGSEGDDANASGSSDDDDADAPLETVAETDDGTSQASEASVASEASFASEASDAPAEEEEEDANDSNTADASGGENASVDAADDDAADDDAAGADDGDGDGDGDAEAEEQASDSQSAANSVGEGSDDNATGDGSGSESGAADDDEDQSEAAASGDAASSAAESDAAADDDSKSKSGSNSSSASGNEEDDATSEADSGSSDRSEDGSE